MAAPPQNESGVGNVIDPTKNVLDLVAAAIQRQDDLRDAETKRQDALREAEKQRVNAAIEAETRRIGELAAIRVYYESIIEGMRTNSLKLLAEQLKENKADSSERTSKLEQFRWESGGRGLGLNAAAGYALALVMAGLALAMYLK